MMKHNYLVFASVAFMASLWGGYGYCDACTTNEDCQAGYRCANNTCVPSPCAASSAYFTTCEDGAFVRCNKNRETKRVICEYNFSGRNSYPGVFGKACVKLDEATAKCGCNTDTDCGSSYICDSKHECQYYNVEILAPQKGTAVNCATIQDENKHIVSCSGNYNLTDKVGTQYTINAYTSGSGFFEFGSGSYIQLSNLRPYGIINVVWGLPEGAAATQDVFDSNYLIISDGENTLEYKMSSTGTTLARFPNSTAKTITVKGRGSIVVKNVNYFQQ